MGSKSIREIQNKDVTRHPLQNYICSPIMNTCLTYKDVIRSMDEVFSRHRDIYDGVYSVFFKSFDLGYLWYPRDRWRTAWAISMDIVREKCMKEECIGIKDRLYKDVCLFRNPSSCYNCKR